MTEVTLKIGGKAYRVACAPGEETRVERLGAAIDDKLSSMGQLGGHDAQNLLFAALLLADEAHEATDAKARAVEELDKLRSESAGAISARSTLSARIEELQTALTRSQDETRAALRDADTATGSRDQLIARVADLEAELSRLQSAHANAAREMEQLLERMGAMKDAIAAHEAEEKRLRGELRAADDRAAQASASASAVSAAGGADIAPALERFAEMLELCADKLEQRAPAP